MSSSNRLIKNLNVSESNLEGQKLEDIVDIFINSLYKSIIKANSYSIRTITSKDANFKDFVKRNERLVYKYANNIKKN